MRINNPKQLAELIFDVTKPVFGFDDGDGLAFSDQPSSQSMRVFIPAIGPKDLGDAGFKKRHGILYPYIAGAMANGITSPQMVIAMANQGMMGFLGAGGLSIPKIEAHILTIKAALGSKPFGFNLIHSLGNPDHEMATVELYLKHGISTVSAAAFMRITPALVYFRVKGIHRDETGRIVTPNKVVAKVSRIEIARQFFSPPPEKILNQLVEMGKLSSEEAALASSIPMAQDLTAEADSGGHTDNRPALALLPTMMALKNQFMETYRYEAPLCVGLAGGIATPESAAAAFSMGAAYILTGSINQACVEAGICEDVKKLLCTAEQADVAMAPAADMFEIGARVQVLKRGTLFAVRAEKLYKIYQNFESYDQVDEKSRQEIEEKLLKSRFEDAWKSTRNFFQKIGNEKEIEKAEQDPKYKMALVFRSYLGQSSKWAIQGLPERKMDYQIWCGPAIGAFNQWVKGTFLENHEQRNVVEVAMNILLGACISSRLSILRFQGVALDENLTQYRPQKLTEVLAAIGN